MDLNEVLDNICADFTAVDQNVDEEKWLEVRRTGIGGSDAGAILGMNKYASPLTVYMSKKNVKGFEGNNATKWGHILEDPIRQETKKELGIEIITIPGSFTSVEYPFMNANLDGVCHVINQVTIGGETVEGLGGHEIKTSSKGDGFTEDEIPDSYYCQVQHYMAVTKLQWFILTVFFMDSRTGKHYLIRKNDDFIYSKLIPAEKSFWENNVLADVAPAPTGVDSEIDYLKKLPVDSEITLDEEAEEIIAHERELDAKIKQLTKEQTEYKNKIILKLAELSIGFDKADKTTAKGNNYTITYNLQVRKSVDSDMLKKDGLYDKYCKESSSKVMRISEVKKI